MIQDIAKKISPVIARGIAISQIIKARPDLEQAIQAAIRFEIETEKAMLNLMAISGVSEDEAIQRATAYKITHGTNLHDAAAYLTFFFASRGEWPPETTP